MRIGRFLFATSICCAVAATGATFLRRGPQPKPGDVDSQGRSLLANGWFLSPVGRFVSLPGDMPTRILVSPDSRMAMVGTCGFHDHSLTLVDLDGNKAIQKIDVGVAGLGMDLEPKSGTVYLSAGSHQPYQKVASPGAVLRFKFDSNRLSPLSALPPVASTPDEQFVSGIACLPDGSILIANVQNDTVAKISARGELISKTQIGYRPYGVAVSPDGSTFAVSNWGSKSVSLLNGSDLSLKALVKVGPQPTSIAYAPDGRLFVANSGSNTVSEIANNQVAQTIQTGFSAHDPIGSSPVALAIDREGKRMYVANADNNDVAIVDISRPGASKVLGFIPTGRYPSAVALTPDGRRLLVATAKGLATAGPNVDPSALKGPVPPKKEPSSEYVEDRLRGDLAIIDLPDERQLARYTKMAVADKPTGNVPGLKSAEMQDGLAGMRKIHHVVFVLKENRTYDTVFGDIAKGNGAPALCLFGKGITPNEHQLVNDFVLFDNLYTDGEVSQVGHQWADAAYATDYNEKQTILNYSRHGEIESDAPPLNSSPGGYIWENAKRHGLTTRIYGEYVEWQEDHNSAHGDLAKDPEKYGCSAEFEKVFANDGRDTEKVAVFLKEMRQAEQTGKWPNMMVMALPEDHTAGLRPGSHTPEAMIGNNDLAVGQLVEGVSHSKFWKDTAIFIIEDDAQDGPDHVDCHRTTGMVVSPYIRRGTVDHTPYSTSSMNHSMEIMLGLPPISQYTQAARPMVASFGSRPDFSPWNHIAPKIDLNARNPRRGPLAERSMKLDFSDIDKADPQEFNEILWEWRKPGTPMPKPIHSTR